MELIKEIQESKIIALDTSVFIYFIEENPWDDIIKLSKPAGLSDLPIRHHEILGDLIE